MLKKCKQEIMKNFSFNWPPDNKAAFFASMQPLHCFFFAIVDERSQLDDLKHDGLIILIFY